MRARDHAGRVLALPSQTPGILAATGLSRSQVNESAWAITRDGSRSAGAAAANLVLRELGPPWALITRLSHLPGAIKIQGWTYAWLTRNRGHFDRWGITAECQQPGVSCGPAGE